MKVEIKGKTVALLVLDELTWHDEYWMAGAARVARTALALTAPAPTDEQERAWRALGQAGQEKARDACAANVPAVLVIEWEPANVATAYRSPSGVDGVQWSVKSDTQTIEWSQPSIETQADVGKRARDGR